MSKLPTILVASLLLASCGSKPGPELAKPVTIPELPTQLAIKAKKLPKLEDPSMGAMVLDATETDKKYNEVSLQLNTLIDVYNCVKESINKSKETKCQ